MKPIHRLIKLCGYELVSAGYHDQQEFLSRIPYMTAQEDQLIERCLPYTQIGRDNLFSLLRATDYIVNSRLPGAFVECGVWKGGAVMAMAEQLEFRGEERDLYLFDTFSGMPSSTEHDVDLDGNNEAWYRRFADKYCGTGCGDSWNAVSLENVRKNISSVVKNCHQRLHYIQGRVEETLPLKAPAEIALLRLDTDFYESTRAELQHLFPRVVEGGVVIVDDYGHFLGARKAFDEYFKSAGLTMLMNRITYSTILGVKTTLASRSR